MKVINTLKLYIAKKKENEKRKTRMLSTKTLHFIFEEVWENYISSKTNYN